MRRSTPGGSSRRAWRSLHRHALALGLIAGFAAAPVVGGGPTVARQEAVTTAPPAFTHRSAELADVARRPVRLQVDFDDGTTSAFTVVQRRHYDKRRLPVRHLFRRNGDAVLTLITCGGTFDPLTRHYASNTVVRARLE